MNIFYLDEDPVVAAQSLVDIHCGAKGCAGKMIVETAQMLANCYTPEQLSHSSCPRTAKGETRGYSYLHHPCSKWTIKSLDNFFWLVNHGQAMHDEKLYRYGNEHFSYQFIKWCIDNWPDLPSIGLTTPALAMKSYPELMNEKDPVGSYRAFYIADKKFDKNGKKMDNYTRRGRPAWFK
jgi:hypothetical protein